MNFLHIFEILGIYISHSAIWSRKAKISFSHVMMYYLRMANFRTRSLHLRHLRWFYIFQLAPQTTVLPEVDSFL